MITLSSLLLLLLMLLLLMVMLLYLRTAMWHQALATSENYRKMAYSDLNKLIAITVMRDHACGILVTRHEAANRLHRNIPR